MTMKEPEGDKTRKGEKGGKGGELNGNEGATEDRRTKITKSDLVVHVGHSEKQNQYRSGATLSQITQRAGCILNVDNPCERNFYKTEIKLFY